MAKSNERLRVGAILIYPRGKKQTWVADYWRDGQHCRQSLRTTVKKVALQRAAKLSVQLTEGSYHKPAPPVSVREAVDGYVAYLKSKDRAARTIVRYKGILERLIGYLAEHRATRLAQFSEALFEGFRAARRKLRHRKTVYTESVVIKQLMKWAKRRKLIAVNPIADVEVEKPRYEVRGGPSLSQINRILAALAEPRHTQIAVLAFTGARAGELQRLRPEDVDLTGNWIHIRSREGARTKTGLSRKVPLHARLRLLLERLPRCQRPWLFTAPPSKKYPDGNHWISTKHLNEDLLKVLKRLGLPAGRDGHGFTVHSLRHFFETHAVNAGIPQRAVDCWLGHVGDQSMAAKYYKLSDEESQAFMARVPFGTGEPAADAGTKE